VFDPDADEVRRGAAALGRVQRPLQRLPGDASSALASIDRDYMFVLGYFHA